MAESLPEELSAGLRETASRRGVFGDVVHCLAETTSTNDVAARLAERGAPEGTTVVALAQTAGRGRFGRTWFSPPGAGLYVSVICRHGAVAPYLTVAGGVALADGIRRATGLPVEIKWPNDIVAPRGAAREPRRKLAGILAEASTASGSVQYVVLGFGINLSRTAYPAEIAARASSIEAELGRAPDPGAVLGETLASLASVHQALTSGHVGGVLDRWRTLAPSVFGAAVEWETPAGPRAGTAAGIDEDGALLIRTGGRLERVISGEVRWS
ncbi:MAG: biotin--[acetyl-CoA-carboxylase] ligase [Acidobacteria bacterium]|nr:biotin--[acetyl-CoA-carboxylase] ligase [Acidobacteriota bacterium]MBA3887043.1 biotin--[acetyl-CoA-carboxylase] ligase [Acidobacteriota bacterium]